MIKISAVIITYNEEHNIGRCIDSVASVADEILIIDSFSDDKTKYISQEKGARFIEHIFIDYIKQKNAGVELALYDFILSIDADEYLSEELEKSILAVKNSAEHNAYTMNRFSRYGTKWIRYTDWYPDRKIRLWNRKSGKWGGPNPHEKVILHKHTTIGHLRGDLLHLAYENSNQLLHKVNQYSSLFAVNGRVRVGSSFFKIFYKTIYAFGRNYFFHKGFLSGLAGLQISFTSATYTFFKYSKLLELNRSLPVFHEEKNSARSYEANGISVVIPNYNGRNLFPHTLDPLVSVMNKTKLPFEIIIVDDCSTDDSVEYILANFPEIKVLQNEKNKGFSCTANTGIFESKYDLVFLLNSDIILTEGYFDHQYKYFTDKDTFGVMGRVIGWHDKKIQDAARLPEFHGLKIKTSGNYMLKPMNNESLYTLYLSGSNALINRKKLIELQGFDEIFSPFYIEDCDLSIRAWRMGWKSYYEHKAVCRHQTSSSVKAKNKQKYIEIIYNRNKLFLHAIHLELYQLPFWFLQIIIEAVVRLIVLKISYLQSIYLFIKQWKDWKESRNKYKRLAGRYGDIVPLRRISKGIRASLYAKRKLKFLSNRVK